MNSKFQLFLETSDPELFAKATSDLGTMFYRCAGADAEKEKVYYEIVYFSGSRIARYVGELSEKLKNLVIASGFQVENIEVDADNGSVKIIDKKSEEA